MEGPISELIAVSRLYGTNKEFVIGGGGNTSYKDDDFLFVKASGTRLATLSEPDLIKMERKGIQEVISAEYPDDPFRRDQMILEGMMRVTIGNEKRLRPSVETPLHHLIGYRFVVHTHPTRMNALLCSQNFREVIQKEFPADVMLVEYTDPGYVLFKKLEKDIHAYRSQFGKDPSVIMVQNHGIFVAADTVAEVRDLYDTCLGIVNRLNPHEFDLTPESPSDLVQEVVPALRMLLSEDSVKVLKIRQNPLTHHFTDDPDKAVRVMLPFTPDNIVYCKSRPLYVNAGADAGAILAEFTEKLTSYETAYGCKPKIILVQGIGLIAADESIKMADILLDVFEDLMKISYLSNRFGGPHFLSEENIFFIENWESENYRHNMSKGSAAGKALNKIIIVTGAAQGFGEGIAQDLFNEGANVVIADLNREKGLELESGLNQKARNNRALFIQTDVSDAKSVKSMITSTVAGFGGLDAIISNAGILHAGGLDEMSPEVFERMTRVNYTGYFLCAKYASAVMKTQASYRRGYFTDIIQINSKSGLRGSKKNFTYAGGKFGGIGLTQSFALELIDYQIKVNSICPGNFFDGPLWSDPEHGLFVQYLKSGKVPNAKTIADVKHYYESLVPARRGCTVADVMKAVYYVMEQEYETGQAIPVTGGQVMLN